LGTPDAHPAQKPAAPQQPQSQRVPAAPQTVVAPTNIPATTTAAAASTSTASDAADTGTGSTGQVGVPWGSEIGVGVDGPPATATVAEQTGPLVAGVGDVKAPIVLRRVTPPYP